MISRVKSEALFTEALSYIPGGVNSPVRAFRAVGGKPFFVNRASGCRVWDVDGNEYIDYVGTWGPAILGHAHPKIIAAVKAAADHGTSFGIPNPSEVTMAKLICSLVPSVQKVRMTNSGTEACMSAIRLARGFTQRDKIIKFDGCYHGHADCLLVKAGSGALTFGNPDSAGVPADFAKHTLVLPYNETEPLKATFAANKNEIACVIVEPVAGNAGLFVPKPGWLEFLREITQTNGALLIFDEVMTGFRLAPGGAQERFGIKPDLSTFGKIIGGGLPVGAFGGRADIMDYLAPLGPVYQAGTLSGNPLAMAAGIAALEELGAPLPMNPVVEQASCLLGEAGSGDDAANRQDACSTTPARSGFRGSKRESLRGILTPALSHPMGEGESSSARGNAGACVKANGGAEAVPSPGGEGQGEGGSKYILLEHLGALLETGMRDAAKSAGVPVTFNRCGSMFCGYFTSEPVWNLADAMKSDRERFKKFFHGMLDAGVYLAPSQFEAGFISTAHSEADLEQTAAAAAKVMRQL